MSGATAAPAAQLNGTRLITGDYNANQSQQPPSGMTLDGVMCLVIFIVALGLLASYCLYDRHVQGRRRIKQQDSQQQHEGEEVPPPPPPPLPSLQPPSPPQLKQQLQPTLARLPTPAPLNPMLGEQAALRTSLTITGDQEPTVRFSDNIGTLNGMLISDHQGPSLLKSSTHPHKLPEPQTSKSPSMSSRSSKNSSAASSVSSATSAIEMHNEV